MKTLVICLILIAGLLWLFSAPQELLAAPACNFTNASLANGSSFTAGQYVGVQANAYCPAAAGTEIDFVLSGAVTQLHVVSLAGTSQTFAGTQFVFSTTGFTPGTYAVSVSANGTSDSQGWLIFTVH